VASAVFLILVMLSFYWTANRAGYILALLIAVSLFIGIIVGQALKGPSYCNPLVAITLGSRFLRSRLPLVTQGGKSGQYIANMIGVEFLAAIIIAIIYLTMIRSSDINKKA
jgi:hypothetical protein